MECKNGYDEKMDEHSNIINSVVSHVQGIHLSVKTIMP